MLHISTVNRKAKLVGVTREVMSPKIAESLPVAGLCWLFTRPLVARDALGRAGGESVLLASVRRPTLPVIVRTR